MTTDRPDHPQQEKLLKENIEAEAGLRDATAKLRQSTAQAAEQLRRDALNDEYRLRRRRS